MTGVYPGTYDFDVYQGDTKEFSLAVSSGPDGGPFVPVDLTGCTAAAQIRETVTAASPSATITCVISDPTGGVIDLSMTPAVTTTLTAGKKVWDIEITLSNGKKFTYLKGTVTVTADVTRVA